MVVAPLHTHKPTWLPKKYIPFPHSFQLQTLITQWLNCLLSSDAYGPTLGVIKHTQPWLARPIPINHGKRERLGLGALVSNAELHSPMPALPPHTHHDKQSSIHPRIHDISWWEKREGVGRLLSAYWPKLSALDKDTPLSLLQGPLLLIPQNILPVLKVANNTNEYEETHTSYMTIHTKMIKTHTHTHKRWFVALHGKITPLQPYVPRDTVGQSATC